MEVIRIIRYARPDGTYGNPVKLRKDIRTSDIVSFEELITDDGVKRVYVFATNHEFVVDEDYDSFKQKFENAKITSNW